MPAEPRRHGPPPRPTRGELAAQRHLTDLMHGHPRRRLSDPDRTFDPPQLAAQEIDAGLRSRDPADGQA